MSLLLALLAGAADPDPRIAATIAAMVAAICGSGSAAPASRARRMLTWRLLKFAGAGPF